MKTQINKYIAIFSAILLPIIFWFCWIAYNESFCESAKLSKKFNSKIESVLKSGIKYIKLSDITDFEWDIVCLYGEEIEALGESVDLKDPVLIRQFGYKPKFFIRSTYYIPYDFVGFVFSNTSKQKIKIMHRIQRKNYKEIFTDLSSLTISREKNLGYLGPNECFKLNKNFK